MIKINYPFFTLGKFPGSTSKLNIEKSGHDTLGIFTDAQADLCFRPAYKSHPGRTGHFVGFVISCVSSYSRNTDF